MSFLPHRSKVVLRYSLERISENAPERDAILFEDGTTWSYRRLVSEAYKGANRLARSGVRRSDHVLVFLPNDENWIRAWLGVAFLGAVIVPVNTAYKGEMLRHICQDSQSAYMVTTPDLAGRLTGLDVNLHIIDPAVLKEGPESEPVLERPIEPWDTHMILYTSGTTGPSKGVVGSYFFSYMCSTHFRENIRVDDTFLIDHPLFHMSGLIHTFCAWNVSARVVLMKVFSGSNYVKNLRKYGITISIMLGSIPGYMEALPEKPDDKDNPLRMINCSPMVKDPDGFMKRFGIKEIVCGFGMSETGSFLCNLDVLGHPTSCGRPRSGIECRLVDENDIPVPPGTAGELIVRTNRPWELSSGYLGRPEDTAKAWRNGWFHTGDILTRDEDDYYYFLDRAKDAIRRRGENISSFEVEREVMAYPPVQEAACVAYLGEYGEGEVKVFIVPKEKACFDPSDLIRFLIPRMPHFMVPRYVEVLDALPKTAVGRIQKFKLKEKGNSESTWDREAVGIKLGLK
jgi:carnitine-CoA ligase